MATIKVATITNHLLCDPELIARAATAGDDLVVTVFNEFLPAAAVDVVISDLPSTYPQAVYDALDAASNQDVPGGSVIITTAFDGTTHTLAGYVRSGIATVGDPINASHEVLLVFMIGWLSASSGVLELPLTLKIGVALDSVEIDTLAIYGITVSGTAASVTVAATVPFKVQAVQPVIPAFDYVFVYQYDINTVY